MKYLIAVFFLIFVWSSTLFSQPSSKALGYLPDSPKIKIECYECEFDFLKRSLDFVNFVRDIQSADVYIKVTSQRTGAGKRFNIYFEGQDMYSAITDTLLVNTRSDNSSLEVNEQLAAAFRNGLLPFLLQSPLKSQIQYTIGEKTELKILETDFTPDPWNFWVFSVRGSANINTESNYNGYGIRTGLNASRKTALTKWSFSYNNRYSESNFYFRDEDNKVIDSLSINSFRKSQSFWASHVLGLSDHWSLAFSGNVFENTYSNYDFAGRFQTGFEYNIYPYSESDRRLFIFKYQVGPLYNNYVDTTIYNQSEEWLWSQEFEAFLSQNQKWGSISLVASFTSFLHDLNLNEISIRPSINWNVFKGLVFELGSDLSFIGNQINLPKDDAAIEDVLLRDKLIATNYEFSSYFSIRYYFGSDFANAVNPRFWGRGG